MEKDELRKAGFPNLLGRTKNRENSQQSDSAATVSDVTREPVAASMEEKETMADAIKSNQAEIEKRAEQEAAQYAEDLAMSDDDDFEPMMSSQINPDLTEEDKREIYDAIDLIRRKLSFAKDFTDEERASLMRLGKTGRTFVEKAQNLVERNPGILPRSFDVEEFSRDADLYQELGNIYDELQKLTERVADTEAAVGSDAFTASLVVYQSGKMARTGDDMDNHLAGWRRKISDKDF